MFQIHVLGDARSRKILTSVFIALFGTKDIYLQVSLQLTYSNPLIETWILDSRITTGFDQTILYHVHLSVLKIKSAQPPDAANYWESIRKVRRSGGRHLFRPIKKN